MSWSSRIVIRTFSGGNGTTGPRFPLLRSYSRFIFACPRILPALARWLCDLKLSECCHERRRKLPTPVHRRPYRMSRSVLPSGVHPASDSTVIVERDDRIKELDSVLVPVRFRLFRVPLKPYRHSFLIVCTVYTQSRRASIQVKLVRPLK